MAEPLYTLTEKSAREVMDTVRAVKEAGLSLAQRRASPGKQLVGYWVEILSEEPNELMCWECLVLGARYIDTEGEEEYVLFDRDDEVRMLITDPNLLRLLTPEELEELDE